MSQKLPVNDFKCVEDISEYDEIFIKSYYKESDEEYFFEVDIQYLDIILPEVMKIEKVERLIAYLHNKNEYVIHIRNFKTRASVKKGT